MKVLQNVLAVGVLAGCGLLIWGFLGSRNIERRVGDSEHRIDDVSREAREHGETLARQDKEISLHDETIRSQTQEIADLKKRLAAAEARIGELTRDAEASRSEIQKLKTKVDDLAVQVSSFQDKRRSLDDLSRDLKKRLEREMDLERRLQTVEKQLGIERPQP